MLKRPAYLSPVLKGQGGQALHPTSPNYTKSINPKNPMTHNNGSKLMIIANRFFFTLNNHDKIEQSITATGYKVIARTKDTLYTLNPLSKLINDNPQMASQEINDSAYRTWLVIKYSFIWFPLLHYYILLVRNR
jgi:hypothetical protein